MKVLVTGGCGFIGSHFIRHLLRTYPAARIINFDALTYAAHPDMAAELAAIAPDRYEFIQGDISSPELVMVMRDHAVEAVVNFAAETHVDRSILDPAAFVMTNIKGVENILSAARKVGRVRVVQVSTDEVYGSLAPDASAFTEMTALEPNSPYAASKASADLMTLASFRTFGQDVIITRCSNNYGPYQFPEKFIPLMLANALEDLPIPIYGDGKQVRDWIYVDDHCRGIDAALAKGKAGEIYNFGANCERFNIDLAKLILDKLGKPHSLLKFVGDRPAHDRRYALDATKAKSELGWRPLHSFEQGIDATLSWYKKNEPWWRKLRGSDYQKFYAANYETKFRQTKDGAP